MTDSKLWWDGCQFYSDTGRSTPASADCPAEGRYEVMFLHDGHFAHQGNADEVPAHAVLVELPEIPNEEDPS